MGINTCFIPLTVRSIIILYALFLFPLFDFTYAAEKQDLRFGKQPEIQQVKPKKPVRIKLKRTAKDEYSWELSGDDPDEIVRTDKRLKKLLNIR